MPLRDKGLAALIAVIWGLAFVASKYGIESFSAAQMTVLRFAVACLPAVVLHRPKIPWRWLFAIGLTLFTGQMLLFFFAYSEGLPPGLASITQQLQVFFTVALAALFLRETPTRRQTAGMVIAFGGMGLIALTSEGRLSPLALMLAVGAPFSWAIGNILLKRLGPMPVVPLIAWLSLVPPLPALAVSLLVDGWTLPTAIAGASWRSLAAVVYLGAASTVLAYALWGRLLARYPAAQVTPFALLAPCVGVVASALIFDERFTVPWYAGMALIFAGLALIALPARWPALRTVAVDLSERGLPR